MHYRFLLVFSLLGLCFGHLSACSPGDSRQCTFANECNPGEECIQGLCQSASGSCTAGQTRPCFTGPAQRRGKGECRDGVQRCQQNGTWGSECAGEVRPIDEICNQKDDNCDGQVDNLQATEEVCDGVDNDCDGKIDNKPGESTPISEPCYSGPAGTKDKGPCKGGTRICIKGKWDSTCKGEVIPKAELCSNSIDEDCDGLLDNVKDLGQACSNPNGQGACAKGVYTCAKDGRKICRPKDLNKKEICNNQDDDCDGIIDNASESQNPLSRPCYTGPGGTKGVGVCKGGQELCQKGVWSSCQNQVVPGTETCNGQDDDCDGKTDNAKGSNTPLTQTCYTGPAVTRGKGSCQDGQQRCVGGKWESRCQGQVVPQYESCGVTADNDCDGKPDKGRDLGANCLDPQRKGACRAGIYVCRSQRRVCAQTTQPTTERCNGQDDDCDGKTDNIKNRATPLSRVCFTGATATRRKGACRDGTERCIGGRWEGICKGQIAPTQETCNQKDDDCDGKTDEDNVCRCSNGSKRTCYTGPLSTQKQGGCKDGQQICQSGRYPPGQCAGEVVPKTEVCNGTDDDCDGKTDNQPGTSFPLRRSCYGGPAGTKDKGACTSGIEQCRQGKWTGQCIAEQRPTPELCDNQDNNCDGQTDEGNACTGKARKLGERCSLNAKDPAYLRCGFNLTCIQADEQEPFGYCYQPCTGNNTCQGNKDGRLQCIKLSSTIGICIGRTPEGAPCNVSKGIFCEGGLFCDRNLGRCRPPTQVGPLEACGGNTNATCENPYVCAPFQEGTTRGYCLRGCSARNPCPGGASCVKYGNTAACQPIGKKTFNNTCGEYNTSKLTAANFCVKGRSCVRLTPINPLGICLVPRPSCRENVDCIKGRQTCGKLNSGAFVCLSLCGTCPKGQSCLRNGNVGICVPDPPTGPMAFGQVCSASRLCRKGFDCFLTNTQQGYCTRTYCQSNTDCPTAPAGAVCRLPFSGASAKACVFPCQADKDCPTGLACDPTNRICVAR